MERQLFRLLGIIASVLFVTLSGVEAQQAVPDLSARVTDLTNTLTSEQKAALEAELQTLEQQKGSQIAVLLVPSTAPEAIEQYSLRVVEKWKLGRAGVDDGVLLLVAKNDRNMRIEVGYGLEGTLTDFVSKRIISEVITPHFRNGKFYQGIQAGVGAIAGVVAGEELPSPSTRTTAAKKSSGSGAGFLTYLAIFTGAVLGGSTSFLWTGLISAVSAFFLGWIVLGVAYGLILSLTLLLVFYIAAAQHGHSGSGRRYRSSRSSGGFRRGGFGGGFSGGGFSGGGGSFGGGGASGRW